MIQGPFYRFKCDDCGRTTLYDGRTKNDAWIFACFDGWTDITDTFNGDHLQYCPLCSGHHHQVGDDDYMDPDEESPIHPGVYE